MVKLQAGKLVCHVQPQLGGCISGLWLAGVPVLRSPAPGTPLDSARQSGGYALVPFSNRIGHATLQWQGTQHPIVRNNAPEPHAIHGIGWQRTWEVLERDDHFVMLSHEHAGDASWPFAFDASQTIRVGERSVEFTLSMTNQSATPAPAGLGWHPFFIKRAGGRIAFSATGRWEMGEDMLPTRRDVSQGLEADCTTLAIDHCFDGWSGVVELRDAVFRTRLTSNLKRLVVFTNPTRDIVAIEPVSHVNNALALVDAGGDPESLGLAILRPGETLTAQMAIEVEHAN